MPILDLPATFVDNTILSAYDINALRATALELDQLSYRQFTAFLSSSAYVISDANGTRYAYPDATKTTSDLRLWRGSFPYRGGMTTLIFEGVLTKMKSESLHFFVSGTDRAIVSANGFFSVSIDISTGHSPGDIISIEMHRVGKTSNSDSDNKGGGPVNYKLYDVYATPMTGFATWPGVPTFTTTYSAAQMNQMTAACLWLRDRIYAHPIHPGIQYLFKGVTPHIETWDLWRGGILRGNTNDVCSISGTVTCYTSAEVLKVYLSGTLMATYPSSGTMVRNTTYTFDLPISLSSISVGTTAELLLQVVVTAPSVDDNGNPVDTSSVYSLDPIGTEAPTGGYPVPSLPAGLVPGATITQATLTSTLNGICTALAAIKTRIDANPNIWNRLYAMTLRPGWDAHQLNSYSQVYNVGFKRRVGTTLYTNGKGVQLGWGGLTMGTDPSKPYVYTFNRTDTLAPADSYQNKTTYPDTYGDLSEGTAYTVFGVDAIYCGERFDV